MLILRFANNPRRGKRGGGFIGARHFLPSIEIPYLKLFLGFSSTQDLAAASRGKNP